MEVDELPFNLQFSQVSAKLWEQKICPEIDESNSSSLDFQIELRVSKKCTWIVRLENGLTVIANQEETSTTRKIFWVNHRVFSHPRNAFSLLSQQLEQVDTHGYIQGPSLQQLCSSVCDKANSLLKAGDGRNVFSMCVEILIEEDFLFDVEAAMARAVSDSMDGEGMIPASKSSIDALERVAFDSEESITDCTICLEELMVGSLVTRMPCSHLFHGDCITRWLETSHLCPLCRFQISV